MALYQLFLRSADMSAQAKDFAFDEIHHALEIPDAQGFDGLGELWRDGSLLCSIEYSARYGYYRIMPAAPRQPEHDND